jgi:hypothetical protein
MKLCTDAERRGDESGFAGLNFTVTSGLLVHIQNTQVSLLTTMM